jgi:hypothetical protein
MSPVTCDPLSRFASPFRERRQHSTTLQYIHSSDDDLGFCCMSHVCLQSCFCLAFVIFEALQIIISRSDHSLFAPLSLLPQQLHSTVSKIYAYINHAVYSLPCCVLCLPCCPRFLLHSLYHPDILVLSFQDLRGHAPPHFPLNITALQLQKRTDSA